MTDLGLGNVIAGPKDSELGWDKNMSSNLVVGDYVVKRDSNRKLGGGCWKRQAWNRGNVCGDSGVKLMRGKRNFVEVLVDVSVVGSSEYGEKKGRFSVGGTVSDAQISAARLGNRKQFHFESCWAEHEECKFVVRRSWVPSGGSGAMDRVANTISMCTQQLHRWNAMFRKSRQADIESLQKEIGAISSNIQPDSWNVIRRLESRLDCLLSEEEEYWKQRSKRLWFLRNRFVHDEGLIEVNLVVDWCKNYLAECKAAAGSSGNSVSTQQYKIPDLSSPLSPVFKQFLYRTMQSSSS
ncbi:hypothetical protein QYF36_007909 [Acer negundo]|nr:hypothetical protein QYF36_007909 [Acer negundo]